MENEKLKNNRKSILNTKRTAQGQLCDEMAQYHSSSSNEQGTVCKHVSVYCTHLRTQLTHCPDNERNLGLISHWMQDYQGLQ